MQTTPQHAQQPLPPSQSQVLPPPPELPPLTMGGGPLSNLPPRDPHVGSYHLDHAASYGLPMGDPTGHPFGESIQRSPSSHDVMSTYPHHTHPMG